MVIKFNIYATTPILRITHSCYTLIIGLFKQFMFVKMQSNNVPVLPAMNDVFCCAWTADE